MYLRLTIIIIIVVPFSSCFSSLSLIACMSTYSVCVCVCTPRITSVNCEKSLIGLSFSLYIHIVHTILHVRSIHTLFFSFFQFPYLSTRLLVLSIDFIQIVNVLFGSVRIAHFAVHLTLLSCIVYAVRMSPVDSCIQSFFLLFL